MKIKTITAQERLDSRGTPRVEAEVVFEKGILGQSIVPSGASTGEKEAEELRDGDPKRYSGKGVQNVMDELAPGLVGMQVFDQAALDGRMIEIDGKGNKPAWAQMPFWALPWPQVTGDAAIYGTPPRQHQGMVCRRDPAGNQEGLR